MKRHKMRSRKSLDILGTATQNPSYDCMKKHKMRSRKSLSILILHNIAAIEVTEQAAA